MLILIICISVIFILSAIFCNIFKDDVATLSLFIISGVILFTSLFLWLLTYSDYISDLNRYEEIKKSYEYSKQITDMDPFDRAEIYIKVKNMNKNIESAKNWNTTFFEMLVPDSFAELELIE